MDRDDAMRALPVEELRRRVYAQGADDSDDGWIRAAAELARRERASGAVDGPDPDAASPVGDDAVGPGGDPAEDDLDRAPARASRTRLAWSVGALAIGLLAGGAIGAAVVTGSPASSLTAGATPSPGSDAPPIASSTGTGSAPDTARQLLGPDSLSDQRSRPVGAVFDDPQQESDVPPGGARADVDAASIRVVQASVGLYAARTASGDLCLLVYPDGGNGVVTCASPEQVAADGLRIAWTTTFPTRNTDGSTGVTTGDVRASWSSDDLITLTTPDHLLAY